MVNKYDKLVDEVLLLNFGEYVEFLDNTLIKISKEPSTKIEDVLYLTDKKHDYYLRYCNSLEKFKKLSLEQQLILDLYILKNQSCHEVAFKLGISVRSFFRRLEKINKCWMECDDSKRKIRRVNW